MVIIEKSNPQVLILGVGNILMGDEGAGVRAVEIIKQNYIYPDNVEIVDGGTSGIELIDFIEKKDVVIIIDAITKKDNFPGDVVLLDLNKKKNFYRNRISPHQLGISEVFQVLEIMGNVPKNIYLIGIVPKEMSPGLELTEEVKKGIEQAISHVKDVLTQYNINLKSKCE